MFRKARLIRLGNELPSDGEAVPGPVSGLAGSALPPSVSGRKSHITAPARNGVPTPGAEAPESGNSGPETGYGAQPSGEDGVPEDMATMVLNGPALDAGLDSGPAGRPGAAADPNLGVREGLDPTSDAAIMLRVAEGDETSFTYLAQKYHRPMIHFLYRMVSNQAIAEELAQEVFLRVYRARGSYRAEARFTTWLYRIATNLAVNYA